LFYLILRVGTFDKLLTRFNVCIVGRVQIFAEKLCLSAGRVAIAFAGETFYRYCNKVVNPKGQNVSERLARPLLI